MRILSLDIDRFGCFEDKHLNFKKGLNIVNGPDGSGKTTLAALLAGMLFGLSEEEKRQYFPEPFSGRYSARMTIETETGKYLIARSFADEGELYVTDLTSGDDLADPAAFLKELLGSAGREDVLLTDARLMIEDPEERETRLSGALYDNAAHLSLLRREKNRLMKALPRERKAAEKETAAVPDSTETVPAVPVKKKGSAGGTVLVILGLLIAAAGVFYYFRGRVFFPLPDGIEFLILTVLGGAALLFLLLGIMLLVIRRGQKKRETEAAVKTPEMPAAPVKAEEKPEPAAPEEMKEAEVLRARIAALDKEIEARTAEEARLNAALSEQKEEEVSADAAFLPVILDDVFRHAAKEREQKGLARLRKQDRQVILLRVSDGSAV